MTDNPFKPQTEMPPEAHDAALGESPSFEPPGKGDFPLPAKAKAGGLWAPAAIATVGLTVFNCVSVPLAETLDVTDLWILIIAMGIGVYFAQAAILSSGLVFAALPFWQRLGLHWLIAALLISSWLLGFQTPNMRGPGWSDIGTIFSGFPLLALAVQLPLWIVRLFFRWQIVHEQDLRTAAPQRPLSIGDLMIATTVVALSFASARAGPEADEGPYWLVWATIMLIAAGVSLASIPLLLVWTLKVKAATRGAIAIWAYATAFSIVAFMLMFIFERSMRREFWPLFIIPCVIFGYAVSLSAGLWILRGRGYRLKIG